MTVMRAVPYNMNFDIISFGSELNSARYGYWHRCDIIERKNTKEFIVGNNHTYRFAGIKHL
jgi:hypothetical protein